MTDHHRALLAGESFQNVVGKALCSHTDNILVHAVCTSTHDATQATCTKLQILIECVDERCLVRIVKHSLYLLTCLLVKGRRKPFFRTCFTLCNQLCIVFHKFPSFRFSNISITQRY